MLLFSLPQDISGPGQQPARIESVESCPHVIRLRAAPAVPETLAGTARRPSGVESPPQDHRRNGRQSLRRLRFSCARTTPRTQKITSVLSAYWGTGRCTQRGTCVVSHTVV